MIREVKADNQRKVETLSHGFRDRENVSGIPTGKTHRTPDKKLPFEKQVYMLSSFNPGSASSSVKLTSYAGRITQIDKINKQQQVRRVSFIFFFFVFTAPS